VILFWITPGMAVAIGASSAAAIALLVLLAFAR
jgi:hypothetical protein